MPPHKSGGAAHALESWGGLGSVPGCCSGMSPLLPISTPPSPCTLPAPSSSPYTPRVPVCGMSSLGLSLAASRTPRGMLTTTLGVGRASGLAPCPEVGLQDRSQVSQHPLSRAAGIRVGVAAETPGWGSGRTLPCVSGPTSERAAGTGRSCWEGGTGPGPTGPSASLNAAGLTLPRGWGEDQEWGRLGR